MKSLVPATDGGSLAALGVSPKLSPLAAVVPQDTPEKHELATSYRPTASTARRSETVDSVGTMASSNEGDRDSRPRVEQRISTDCQIRLDSLRNGSLTTHGAEEGIDVDEVLGCSFSQKTSSCAAFAMQGAHSSIEQTLKVVTEKLRLPQEEIPEMLDGKIPRCCFFRRGSARASIVDMLLSIIALWSAVVAPLLGSFWLSVNAAWEPEAWLLHAEIIFGLCYGTGAILIRLRTSVWQEGGSDLEHDYEHVRPMMVCQKVLTKCTFWLDAVSLVPTVWMILTVHENLQALKLPGILREGSGVPCWMPLLCLLRVWRLSRPGKGSAGDVRGLLHIGSFMWLIMWVLLIAHLFACFWYFIMSVSGGLDHSDRAQLDIINSRELSTLYSHSIHAGTGIVSGGFSPTAVNNMERFALATMFPASATVMAVVFAELVVVNSRISVMSNRRHEHMALIRSATRQLGCEPALQRKIIRYHAYVQRHHNADCQRVLGEGLPQNILVEIKLQLFAAFIRKAPLLHSLTSQQVVELVLAFEDFVFAPGDLIVRQGDFGQEMFFIIKGTCDVMSENFEHLAVKQRGDYFGEACLLYPHMRRTANVRTRTFSVIAQLRAEKFDEIFKEGEAERQAMSKRLLSQFNMQAGSGESQEDSSSPGQSLSSPSRFARSPRPFSPSSASPSKTQRFKFTVGLNRNVSSSQGSSEAASTVDGLEIKLEDVVGVPPLRPGKSTPKDEASPGISPVAGFGLRGLTLPIGSLSENGNSDRPARTAAMGEQIRSFRELEPLAVGLPLTPASRPQQRLHAAGTPSPFVPQSPWSPAKGARAASHHDPVADDCDLSATRQESRLQRLEQQSKELTHLVRSIRRDMDELLCRVAPQSSSTEAHSTALAPMSAAAGGGNQGHFGALLRVATASGKDDDEGIEDAFHLERTVNFKRLQDYPSYKVL